MKNEPPVPTYDVPGYPGVTVDPKTKTVYGKQGKPINLKKGTGKYYIKNKRGDSKLVSYDEIIALLPVEEQQAAPPVVNGFEPGTLYGWKKRKGGEYMVAAYLSQHTSGRDGKTYAKLRGDDDKIYFTQVDNLEPVTKANKE